MKRPRNSARTNGSRAAAGTNITSLSKRKPLRGDLDAAAPNNPVVLTRAGGHSSVGNSKALELADINPATPDPPRGLIEKDASGAPNGVIRERSDLYTRLVPKDKPADVRDSLLQECPRSAQARHHQRDRSGLFSGSERRRILRRVGASVPEARRGTAARIHSGRVSLARRRGEGRARRS